MVGVPLQNCGATPAEVAAAMPGDDLFAGANGRPTATGTRAITIDAPAARIFDFLAQMGFGRAGWYSYDWIDNLGRKSATEIHPEWLVTSAGDAVPGGPIEFDAVVVDRPDALVLQVPHRAALGHRIDFSLAYQLDSLAAGRTRLVSRVCIAIDGPAGSALEWLVLAGDGVMVRRQLLGVAARAEQRTAD